MHPIEHLRYVARAHGADPVEVALEAAEALVHMVRDPAGVVVSARRMMEHHPDNSSLWWMCAHAVTSMEPQAAIRECVRTLSTDATSAMLQAELPTDATVCTAGWSGHLVDAVVRRGDVRVLVVDSLGEGQDALRVFARRGVDAELVAPEGIAAAVAASDVTIVTAKATSRDGVLCAGGALPLVALARLLDRPSWLVAPEGMHLAPSLWKAMKEDLCGRPDSWASGYDVMEWAYVSHIVDGTGIVDVEKYLARVSCPDAPELLRRSAI